MKSSYWPEDVPPEARRITVREEDGPKLYDAHGRPVKRDRTVGFNAREINAEEEAEGQGGR